jgi:mannosyltransferase OCH1-like enzyme
MDKPPKIIHQTWKTKEIPEWAKSYHESWKKLHPDWTLMLWTDDSARDFIKTHEPNYLEIYDNFPKQIMRVDFSRYAWLYHIGGLYVDLDFECLNSFEPLRSKYELVLGKSIHGTLSNSIMMSRMGHPFWKKVMETSAQKFAKIRGKFRLFPSLDVLKTTGSVLLHVCAKEMGYFDNNNEKNGVYLAEPKLFFPYSCFSIWNHHRKDFPGCMAVHRHQTTWAPHIKAFRLALLASVVVLIVFILIFCVSKTKSAKKINSF